MPQSSQSRVGFQPRVQPQGETLGNRPQYEQALKGRRKDVSRSCEIPAMFLRPFRANVIVFATQGSASLTLG